MPIETLSQLFQFSVKEYNKPDLLIYRGQDGNFTTISSDEFKSKVIRFALGLKQTGVRQQTKITLLSENRPEWHFVDFACHLLNAITVPIFPTLIPEQIEYIVNNSESELIVVSNKMQAEKIHKIKNNVKKVKHVIVMDSDAAQGDMVSFADVLETANEKEEADFLEKTVKLADAESLASIIYTSGTTGVPKGVMLTHRNFVSNVLDCSEVLKLTPEDKALSFLPLSHAFERTVDYVYFYRGCSIVYSPNIENVAQDLQESAPTIMAAVPRFYEKVKARVEAKASEEGRLKRKILDWAVAVGEKKVDRMLNARHKDSLADFQYKIADKLVFSKIRARTGGKIKYFISGGAPLSPEVARFFFAAGLTILEGYGLTETAPVITVNPIEKPKLGTVGKLLRNVQVKIADDGEILAKGPNIMKGYYKMPAETDEVLSNGWLYTGDIGSLDDEGYLSITDRKKQLLVTSVGKKVAPQAIEKEVENSQYIDQVVLIGEKRNFVSALIVPNFDALKAYAKENNIKTDEPQELIQNQSVIDLIQKQVDERQQHFSDYEKIRKFTLLPEAFSIESGELTPTMKVKRRVVEEKYADAIEKMYET